MSATAIPVEAKEEALRDIHVELADLNKEAGQLAKTIQQNFEELGI